MKKSQEKLSVTQKRSGNPVNLSTPTNQSSSISALGSKSRTISYAVTKSFIRSKVAGTTAEADHVAKVQQGLQFQGDVKIVSQIEGTQEILCIAYTEQCEMLAAGLSDGTIRMFKINSGQYVTALGDAEMRQNPGPTTAIKHRPVNKSHPITQTLTATYATGCVKCWHYPTGQCLYTIREKRQTLGLGYHPSLPKFVTVGDDTNIYLYDEETKIQERVFHAGTASETMNGHTSRVFCACFNPKSSYELISGGWDDTVQFWDTRQPYATRRIFGVHMCGDGIDISKTGKEILTCAWQRKNPLQLWDYGSGKLMVSIEPDIYNSQLYCGKYINNLFIVCGGGDANLVRIVDLRSHTSVASVRNLSASVVDLDIGPQATKRVKRSTTMNDVPQLPKIAFCCGKKIYEIEIG